MSHFVELNEAYKAKLVENWAPVINVEGFNDVKNQAMRSSLAQILENTYKDLLKSGFNPQILKEHDTGNREFTLNTTNLTGGHVIGPDGAAGQQDWKQGDVRIPLAVIPLARRMFTQLIAHDLVGVQAMASPTGYAAAFRYVYGSGDNVGEEIVWGKAGLDPAFSGTTGTSDDPTLQKELSDATSPATPLEATGDIIDLLKNSVGVKVETGDDGKVVLKKAKGVDVGVGENMSFNPNKEEGDTDIPRLSVKLEKILVEAKTRKIGTSISMEDAEDALVTLGLDINEAMVNMLAMDLKNSIDRELLQEIMIGAVGTQERAKKTFSVWDAATADGLDQMGRLSALYTHVLQMSKRIQFNTKMGVGANWMVCSSPVSPLIDRIADWKMVENDVNVDGAAIAYAGTLRKGIKVYNDALSNHPYILLGWKGSNITETGVVYCPYIPTQLLSAPDTDKFGARLMARTRYALINSIYGTNLFYQVIALKNVGEGADPVTGFDAYTGAKKVFATI